LDGDRDANTGLEDALEGETEVQAGFDGNADRALVADLEAAGPITLVPWIRRGGPSSRTGA
jgi:hypothetical protein